ncbi:PREDICTED: sorting nexin-24-like [Dufourea novaeangliae]|uniref:Sorting nexin-24 n=1 Tax=Dufourea novaeangliae TaxID=178035 RepID=A0A154PFA5_DUFNO|nr:PREDICTED: sorting nexin-24-like [Dufourea novaeangliae]KZC09988.1 Sorting nexin-24 [Dufourea novaeangliae]
MYQVFISRYRLAEVSHGKPYYVYCIEVLESERGTQHFIERRYSEFSALHRTLKKENAVVAPFPPKRVRNCQPKVLEQRRAALELYIKKMLRLSATKQQVLNFLGIESRATVASYKSTCKDTEGAQQEHPNTLGHYPVLSFHCDPYTQSNSSSSLPDIVINGVLLGIYKS